MRHPLFRSSTPIEPAIGRDEYAMAAMGKAGIRSVINLDDSAETMRNYSTYQGSYYSRCKILNSEMGYDFESEVFAAKVKGSVLFIIQNDDPASFTAKRARTVPGSCALLESFAGTSTEEVMRDHMITYSNYYGVSTSDAVYSIILKNNLVKTLCGLFRVDNIDAVNLKEKTEKYFISIGLTEEQLDILGEKFVKD